MYRIQSLNLSKKDLRKRFFKLSSIYMGEKNLRLFQDESHASVHALEEYILNISCPRLPIPNCAGLRKVSIIKRLTRFCSCERQLIKKLVFQFLKTHVLRCM